MTIHTIRNEPRRGCGYRKPGGFYLVTDGPGMGCGKLPFALHLCPTCGAGIKFARGWQWIDSHALFGADECGQRDSFGNTNCWRCPLAGRMPIGRVLLLWVGEQFYSTPAAFEMEANTLGISRRIAHVPRGFEIGKTWVWLAHIKAMPPGTPGVFRVCLPSRVEYIIKDGDTDEHLEDLEKRGITLVKLERDGDEAEEGAQLVGWPGDGSGVDDLADFNQREADDYRNE